MTSILSQNLLYSCEEEHKRGNEQFIPEHAFGMVLSGATRFHTLNGELVYPSGTIGLIRRNQLAKTIKIPAENGEAFKSINIILDQVYLKAYASEKGISAAMPYKGDAFIDLTGNLFIKSYFESLLPYFDQPNALTPALAELKTREAIELLLSAKPDLKYFLFDFNEPHKIDIEGFMNRNFVFNISLSEFAKMTGRSLATFKRDFGKIFQLSPEKWLQQKRLEKAHYLIKERGVNVSDVYLDVGFENLSHFSKSFKLLYGVTPSSLQGKK